jgi:hypothetical protein
MYVLKRSFNKRVLTVSGPSPIIATVSSIFGFLAGEVSVSSCDKYMYINQLS